MKKIISLVLTGLLLLSQSAFAEFGGCPFGDCKFGEMSNTTWDANFALPPNVATNYPAWVAWMNNRMHQFMVHAPTARATTYYFSNNNSSDGNLCTKLSPCATIAKCKSLVNASSGNVACLFDRGSIFRESTDLNITVNNVTISDYYDGINDDAGKPMFLDATKQYLDVNNVWTNIPATNAYTVTETSDIAWVLVQNDRLGVTRGTPLIRAANAAAVQSLSNSFFWGANLLTINLGGTDPNTLDLEAIVSNTDNGVAFNGDGCRAQNIVAIGQGASRTNTSPQTQPFSNFSTGTDANLFVNDEGYYSGSHAMAHYAGSGSGGKAMFINPIVGYTKYNSSGETLLNTYSNGGLQETWFINPIIRFGTLPSSDWSYTTLFKRGRGIYGHTQSTSFPLSLAVAFNVVADNTPYMISSIGGYADTPDSGGDISLVRGFIVNAVRQTNGTTAADQIDIFSSNVIYGLRDYSKRLNASPFAFSGGVGSPDSDNWWLINSYLEMDGSQMVNGIGVWNRDPTVNNKYNLWHDMIKWTNVNNAYTYALDYDSKFNTTTIPDASATSRNSYMFNSIYSFSANGTWTVLGLYNSSTNLKNNAYYNVQQYANKVTGYDNDAGKQTPGSQPVIGVSQAQLLGTGSTAVLLSNDINGKLRTSSPPDIGPVDFSSTSGVTDDTVCILPNGDVC